MLIQEAQWFAEQLALLEPRQVFPMCNVGSSTEAFRTRDQPWIDRLIFAPARHRGQVVKHLDMQSAPGVDIVGDLCEPEFLARIAQMQFRSVFCSNLLEHVVQREAICHTLLAIIPVGGYLFLSTPCCFPYHPDPIDTGFRPTIGELAALFPGTRQIAASVVVGQTLLGMRTQDPVVFAFTLVRCLFPMYKPVAWWRNRGYLPWFHRRLTASCVILRKEATT